MNWDEDFLERQHEMERRLDQEKEDRDFAQKLQSESQTLSSSSQIKSSKRQLSLMEFSSKVSDELSNCCLESPRMKQDEKKTIPPRMVMEALSRISFKFCQNPRKLRETQQSVRTNTITGVSCAIVSCANYVKGNCGVCTSC